MSLDVIKILIKETSFSCVRNMKRFSKKFANALASHFRDNVLLSHDQTDSSNLIGLENRIYPLLYSVTFIVLQCNNKMCSLCQARAMFANFLENFFTFLPLENEVSFIKIFITPKGHLTTFNVFGLSLFLMKKECL